MKTDTKFYFKLNPPDAFRAAVDMIQTRDVHFIRRAIRVIREMNRRLKPLHSGR